MSNVSGDVAAYSPPLKHDSIYRGCPCFNISKTEFLNLIKNYKVPDKIKNYSNVTGTDKLYMKSNDHNITINFKKFKELFGMK